MWVEGTKVAWCGPYSGEWPIGLVGTVLADAGSGAHVLWPGGRGVTLVASHEIVRHNSLDGLDDSLDVGTLQVDGVQHIAERQGVVGVLNVMADQGHLASFPEIAEQALRFIQGRIRADAAIRAVAEQLDEEDAEALYATAAAALIRDAYFTEPEG